MQNTANTRGFDLMLLSIAMQFVLFLSKPGFKTAGYVSCMCVIQKYNSIHLRHDLRRSGSIHVPARFTEYMDRVRLRRVARASTCCVIRYGR